jgi:hypothetical protein
MKMIRERNSTSMLALGLILVAVLACNLLNETDKANKLVDEGNAAAQDGKKFLTEAEEKRQAMMTALPDIKSAEEPVAARGLAKDAIAAYDKARAKCNEAANKYEEASKLKINAKFKEYLTLKAKEYKTRAELMETAKGTPQALIDSSGPSMFIAKAKENDAKVSKLVKEADDLGAQAEKVHKENKGIFRS